MRPPERVSLPARASHRDSPEPPSAEHNHRERLTGGRGTPLERPNQAVTSKGGAPMKRFLLWLSIAVLVAASAPAPAQSATQDGKQAKADAEIGRAHV